MTPCEKLFTRLHVEDNSSEDHCTRRCHQLHGISTTIVFMPLENYNVLFVSQKANALGAVYKISTSANTRNVDVECVFGAKESGDDVEVVISRRIYQLLLTHENEKQRSAKQHIPIDKPLLVSLLFDRAAILTAGVSEKQFAIDLIQLLEELLFKHPR